MGDLLRDLLPIIFVLLIVISIPLLILWLAKELNRKRAQKMAEQLPEDVKRLLKISAGYTEITLKERLQHSLRVIIIGLIVYFIFVIIGIVKSGVSDPSFDLKTYFMCSLVILAFIIVFVLKDILKAAPWAEVYRIKAVPCLSIHGTGGGTWVCYYDFIKEEFICDALPDTSFITSKNASQNGVIDILAVAKSNRLKLIDIIK